MADETKTNDNKKISGLGKDVLVTALRLALYFFVFSLASVLCFYTPLGGREGEYSTVIIYGAAALTGLILLPKESRKIIPVTAAKRPAFLEKTGIFLAIVFASVSLTVIMNRLFVLIPWDKFLSESAQYSGDMASAPPLWVSIVGGIIFAPLAEEVCFRGILQPFMVKWLTPPIGIVFTAFFFAMYHGNVEQGLYAFIMGIVLGFAAWKTESLASSVVLHMAANGIVTWYARDDKLFAFLIGVPGTVITVLAGIAGVVLFILFMKKKPEQSRTPETGRTEENHD